MLNATKHFYDPQLDAAVTGKWTHAGMSICGSCDDIGTWRDRVLKKLPTQLARLTLLPILMGS